MKNLIDESGSSNATVKTSRFDPSALRLSQNFIEAAGVKKLLSTIPVRKPNKQDFNRVHPKYRLETLVLELKESNETYLVANSLWNELHRELTAKVLFIGINRDKVLFVWPIRLPSEDGRHDNWNASALQAADIAKNNWLRVSSNLKKGAYELYQATGDLPDPEWPDMEFDEILNIAFKDHYIDTLDHPALRLLRGEI